jgi:hypothetical protein
MRHLPGAYLLALRLRDAGVAGDLMAERLVVKREARDPLSELAELTLAAIAAR